jgi:hypothetical protein
VSSQAGLVGTGGAREGRQGAALAVAETAGRAVAL